MRSKNMVIDKAFIKTAWVVFIICKFKMCSDRPSLVGFEISSAVKLLDADMTSRGTILPQMTRDVEHISTFLSIPYHQQLE